MNCSVCGERMIPAGISKKTGKPYQAFCGNKDCSTRQKATPEKVAQVFGGTQQVDITPKQLAKLIQDGFKEVNEKLDLLSKEQDNTLDDTVDWGK